MRRGWTWTGSEPAGQSLQLVGAGHGYAQLHWASAQGATPGAVNVGQDFTAQNDVSPSVVQSTPADAATTVEFDATVSVNFNEPVSVAQGWYTITCASSGVHSASVTGGPPNYMLLANTPFVVNESCAVLVSALHVTALGGRSEPMVSDYSFGFSTLTQPICGSAATSIHDIQGAAAQSPLLGQTVTIEGVVVGDFQGSAGLGGFFVQEEDAQADNDPLTSEGLFVYQGYTATGVLRGDTVRVTGKISEYYGLTELDSVTRVRVCGSGATVTPTLVSLPLASPLALEAIGGMSVRIPQTHYASETYNLGRYGEVTLSANGRLMQPTNVVAPGAPAQALQAANDLARIELDDGSNLEHPKVVPYLVTTLDTGAAICGPIGGLDCRGANTSSEFSRQRVKILSALVEMNADIVELTELENNESASIQDLVNGLNSQLGKRAYAFIDTGTIGTDAIKVCIFDSLYEALPWVPCCPSCTRCVDSCRVQQLPRA